MSRPVVQIIGSGSYAVAWSSERPLLLQALLGSCVGVALFDKEAGIGGLIHLLLPEPADADNPSAWEPFNYAATGLPLFMAELLAAGASEKRLAAVVAGGALYGTVSPADLHLDIGGRTSGVVHAILQQKNIPLLRSETGGRFGSKLTVNTATWETEIDPFIDTAASSAEPFARPTDRDMDQAIARLSSIPQVALQLIRLVRTQDYNFRQLAREVEVDQVIGAKVLQMCNSSLFGLNKHIDSLDRALTQLGENRLIEIVLSACLDTFFAQAEGGYSLMRGGLYHHSLGVAHAARAVAQLSGGIDPGAAYTAGLLHDIGKVVLDRFFARSFPLFYQHERLRDKDLVVLEQEALGVDHLVIGARLGRLWSLPDNLVAVISNHHYPEETAGGRDTTALVHAVYLADVLTSAFLAGREREVINTGALVGRIKRLGLRPDQLPVIVDRVPWRKLTGG